MLLDNKIQTSLRSNHQVVIIAGPTASGKSDCAVELARRINGEIINADSAQMYTKISIGTAKPLDLVGHDVPHHLFNICSKPVDFDVVQYRETLLTLVDDICSRGRVPILVGGSLFYIKSLLFPPQGIKGDVVAIPAHIHALSTEQLWNHLAEIDPLRASQIHMHDTYRVMRALAIWYDSGHKPSELIPQFRPPFKAHVLFLSPPTEVLYERINRRCQIMIQDMGWVDEVRALMEDEQWLEFVIAKGFIGYQELAEWIAAGSPPEELAKVTNHIKQETRNYAKRQRTFWRSFLRQLEAVASGSEHGLGALIEAENPEKGLEELIMHTGCKK